MEGGYVWIRMAISFFSASDLGFLLFLRFFFSFEFPAVDPVEIGKKKHAWVKPLQSKASRNRIPSTGKSEFLKSS